MLSRHLTPWNGQGGFKFQMQQISLLGEFFDLKTPELMSLKSVALQLKT
jgi:hypothetical protein